jgi:hypothetical protein
MIEVAMELFIQKIKTYQRNWQKTFLGWIKIEEMRADSKLSSNNLRFAYLFRMCLVLFVALIAIFCIVSNHWIVN